tara:strand:- start:671 stop:970 length:300 start_codon:yes stop_codon:yes gene_type:complete
MSKEAVKINENDLVANEYISIETEIKKLQEKKAVLKETLIRRAEQNSITQYKVDKHTLHVSWVQRKVLDMKKVRAKLTRQFIQANTNITENYTIKIMGR